MCWDARINEPNNFCYKATNWKLSEEVYYDSRARDDGKSGNKYANVCSEARRLYENLLTNWEKKREKDCAPAATCKAYPGNDCLAIARSHFCAWKFPKCNDALTVSVYPPINA